MQPADTVASSYRMTASSEEDVEEEEGGKRQGGGSWETEKARSAPKGNKSLTVSGNRRQMDHFLAAVYHFLCQFLFLKKSYLCELFCCWAVGYLFIRKHVFVYARCRAQGDDDLKVNLHSSTVKG